MAASAALTGNGADGMNEPDVVVGWQEIYITLTSDTWKTAQNFNDARQAIIDGFDAAANPTNGWNNRVRDAISVVTVQRLSDTTVLLRLPAVGAYAIASNETVTCIVPASALAGAVALTATPTITITETSIGTSLANSDASEETNNYLLCQRTGFKIPISEGLIKDGYGLWVRAASTDRRHPQEMVRSVSERRDGSVAPEPVDTFITTAVSADDL